MDEWSARRRDLYLTTHNTDNRQISKPLVGFEPTISAGTRPLGPTNEAISAIKYGNETAAVQPLNNFVARNLAISF
jgi:hypothetical protein